MNNWILWYVLSFILWLEVLLLYELVTALISIQQLVLIMIGLCTARAWIRFRSPYKVIIRVLPLVLHYVLVSIGWHHCRTQNVIGPRNWSTVMWPVPIGWWRRVSPAIYTTRAQDLRSVCCFGSLWDSSSSRLGSTPPSASSTEHCRQQPLLRESPPVARARPHTFHAVYCLGVSPTPPGGLERPVIRVTRAPRIKNL